METCCCLPDPQTNRAGKDIQRGAVADFFRLTDEPRKFEVNETRRLWPVTRPVIAS